MSSDFEPYTRIYHWPKRSDYLLSDAEVDLICEHYPEFADKIQNMADWAELWYAED